MEAFDSAGQHVMCEVFRPAAGSAKGGVVIAHGTAAMEEPFGRAIRDFGGALAASGIAAVVPYYLGTTPRTFPPPRLFLQSACGGSRYSGTVWPTIGVLNLERRAMDEKAALTVSVAVIEDRPEIRASLESLVKRPDGFALAG